MMDPTLDEPPRPSALDVWLMRGRGMRRIATESPDGRCVRARMEQLDVHRDIPAWIAIAAGPECSSTEEAIRALDERLTSSTVEL